MRLKINFESGLKININLKNPKCAVVRTSTRARSFDDIREAVTYSVSLSMLGIENSVNLKF